MIRDDIKAALVTAIKGGDKAKTGTIRLIQAALKNREIELRGAANPPEDDALITEILQKMVKQRRESIAMFETGNRPELAAAEQAEVSILEGFLPRQLNEDEAKAAIDAIVTETGAASVKDMGRVMAALKDRHATEIDMSKASALVKARLSA